MAYDVENLTWVKQWPQLNDDEQLVLLALSDERFQWRTLKGIIAATALDRAVVEEVLAKLIREKLVRPSFSREREIIYGLVDRIS
ncbi:MAG TPA: hypothetical protein VFC46_17495 [Humisphaera sp.]|nr:hypothetical protein [Humisphaera sp.]